MFSLIFFIFVAFIVIATLVFLSIRRKKMQSRARRGDETGLNEKLHGISNIDSYSRNSFRPNGTKGDAVPTSTERTNKDSE